MKTIAKQYAECDGAVLRFACAILILGFTLSACATAGSGLGAQAGKAIDPAGFAQSVQDPRWIIAAVRYEAGGDGFDYSGTKLMPVLLVFKNKGPGQPQALLEDVRGLGSDSDFLVYSTDEAVQLAVSSKGFNNGVKAALQGAGVGGAIGAGLGALVGLVISRNPNAIWQGAIIGGAMGSMTGAASSLPQAKQELRRALQTDLESHAWHEDPIPSDTIRLGYLFLPASQGIRSVRITVRSESGDAVYTLPIVSSKEYDPGRAIAAPPGASPVKPAAAPSPDAPAPKRVPKQTAI